jgi:uncharacterized integral membrane protein (TIGR00697 family)
MGNERPLTIFIVLAGVYIAGAVVTNVIGSKIMHFIGLNFTAGMIAYCVTFPITDTVGEIWGRNVANKLVHAGIIGNVILIVLTYLAVHAEPAPFWDLQESYAEVLGFVPRIVTASLSAFVISQYTDVFIFDYLKRKMKGRNLWVRNNLSTWISQFIDSLIFVTVAFVGTISWGALMSTFIGQYVIKILIAAIDTPVVYVLVAWIRRGETHFSVGEATAT